jgi:hypothetical protein
MWIFIPEFLMVKELDPILEKLLLMDPFKASIEVRMPTNAMIPKAMMRIVRTVLSIWLRMAVRAILTFSRVVMPQK